MIIKGKYEVDSNFTTVYANNKMYTIAKNTGEWGVLPVGEKAYIGGVLTQEVYDKLASECDKEGTFELS